MLRTTSRVRVTFDPGVFLIYQPDTGPRPFFFERQSDKATSRRFAFETDANVALREGRVTFDREGIHAETG